MLEAVLPLPNKERSKGRVRRRAVIGSRLAPIVLLLRSLYNQGQALFCFPTARQCTTIQRSALGTTPPEDRYKTPAPHRARSAQN